MTKKIDISIEGLLSWTFRDELPKRQHDGGRGGATIHPMWRAGRFGARIDNWTREPGYPSAMGDPDPDALEVEMAVQGLVGYGLRDVPTQTMIAGLPLADVDVAPALQRATAALRVLVAMHAKLQTRPGVGSCDLTPRRLSDGSVGIWRITDVVLPTLMGETAYRTEVPCRAEKKTRAGRIYPDGAYCCVDWTPHPRHVLLERAEYLAWRAALAHLARELDGKLRRYVVLDTDAPVAPWVRQAGRPAALIKQAQ